MWFYITPLQYSMFIFTRYHNSDNSTATWRACYIGLLTWQEKKKIRLFDKNSFSGCENFENVLWNILKFNLVASISYQQYCSHKNESRHGQHTRILWWYNCPEHCPQNKIFLKFKCTRPHVNKYMYRAAKYENPGIYYFKVDKESNRKRCGICSKNTRTTTLTSFWCLYC